MNNINNPTARKSGLVIQEVPDEMLVFDTETNKAHCLNETAALVWHYCDGTNSVAEITSELQSKTGKKVSSDLVWLALDQLSENKLLEAKLERKFAGPSRRDVIKKIGLASMIAIPVVASLVAPQNALANLSCVCASNANCTVGVCNTSCCGDTSLLCVPNGSETCTG